MSKPENSRPLFLGLLCICVSYTLYKIYFGEDHLEHELHLVNKIKHLIKFSFILLVYTIGYFALRKTSAPWLMLIWNCLYAAIAILLVFVGLDDWIFPRAPAILRNFADALHQFLISPVLYVAVWIINTKWGKAAG